MSAPADPPLDAWGMPIVPPQRPILDVELGFTTEDDGDGEWEPKPPDMPVRKFLTLLGSGLTLAGLTGIKAAVIRVGLHRRKRYL